MRQDLVSKVINFSTQEIFQKYEQKYSLHSINHCPGLIGIELRNLPDELSAKHFKKDAPVFLKNKDALIFSFPDSLSLFEITADKKMIEISEYASNAINNFIKYNATTYKIGNKQFSFDSPVTFFYCNILDT